MADRNKDDNLDFEKAALPYLGNIYRAAVALCGQSSEAEDLTQTTFLKAFEKFNTFVPGTDCRAWLMRILRNVWIDRLRRTSTAGTQVPLDESAVAKPEVQESPVWSNAEDL
jgi:RNA polymerase sigma-70 factor (ECF subfamily)